MMIKFLLAILFGISVSVHTQAQNKQSQKKTAKFLSALKRGDISQFTLISSDNTIDVNLTKDHHQNSPLHLAIESMHKAKNPQDIKKFKKIINQLIEAGADVNAQNNRGETPLHASIEYYQDIAIIKQLLKAGANVNIQDNREETPLFFAITYYHKYYKKEKQKGELVASLIKAGADVNVQNKFGENTVLHLASGYGYPHLVNLLIINGADVSVQNTDSQTPLHKAVVNHHTAVIAQLIKNGAKVNVRQYKGYTPLHLVMMNKKHSHRGKSIIIMLLEAGADMNAQDNRGQTPLHIAAKMWRLEAIKVLLENGADVNIQDNNENTVYCATKNDYSNKDTKNLDSRHKENYQDVLQQVLPENYSAYDKLCW